MGNIRAKQAQEKVTGESFAPENPFTQRLAKRTDRRPKPSS